MTAEVEHPWHDVVCPICKSGEHLTASGSFEGRIALLQRHDDNPRRYLVEYGDLNVAAVEGVRCLNCGFSSAVLGEGTDPWLDLVRKED